MKKAFSNILLPREEQLARKRTQIEMEKQKREPDEVNIYNFSIYIADHFFYIYFI